MAPICAIRPNRVPQNFDFFMVSKRSEKSIGLNSGMIPRIHFYQFAAADDRPQLLTEQRAAPKYIS
jgi:hypothetical protein